MYRIIENELLVWKTEPGRKPLLLRGARQVGKSYVIEKFGKNHFENTILINFEFEPKYRTCFNTLDPEQIINAISLMSRQDIVAEKTLLVLDEIQECPQAILALRYFKEKMPHLHVIGAGSLLEFVLNGEEFRMPVGRVQSLYMKPCSFKEYLIASDNEKLSQYLEDLTIKSEIHPGIHETLLQLIREYFFIGGMPEVIAHYIEHKNIRQCQILQAGIHDFYRRDFGKYDRKIKKERLQLLYDKAPGLVGEKFQYVKIDPDIQARDLKPALHALRDAGILNIIQHTSASGLPLKSTVNERKFKLLFVDTGLMVFGAFPNYNAIMNEHLITLNRGAIAEQFVGQELLAYQPCYYTPELYFWDREERASKSEVDYITSHESQIIPIEVKAGKTGRLKSLQIFLNEKNIDIGVRVSQNQFSFQKRILSIPLYMVHEISRLYSSIT